MAYETKPDEGSLFPPRDKNENPKAPQAIGKAIVVCRSCNHHNPVRLSAWKNISSAGVEWLKLKFSDPQPQGFYQETQGSSQGQQGSGQQQGGGYGQQQQGVGQQQQGGGGSGYQPPDNPDIPF